MENFKNSKTCVVLENESILYNEFIKDAVEKYWKSTEFEFIDQKEFEKRRFNSEYSFLLIKKGVFENDPDGLSYNYLSLLIGDATIDISKMPEVCSIPISCTNDDCFDYKYAIPSILKFMQKHATNLEKKRHFLISLEGYRYYNFSADFKDKVLLLNKDIMSTNANSKEKIKNAYPYNFKLLDSSELEAELATNPTKTMFNFHVGPNQEQNNGKCLEMIFDVEGNLYYYYYRNISNNSKNGFDRKDLINILTE